jgi:hypothetical protein
MEDEEGGDKRAVEKENSQAAMMQYPYPFQLPPVPAHCLATSREYDAQLLQPIMWGLDSLYWAYAKVLIAQVLALRGSEQCRGYWRIGVHPVLRVEVLGYVVGVKVTKNHVRYTIDDGTGVLQCNNWFKQLEQPDATGQRYLVDDSIDHSKRLGELCRCRGRLKPGYFIADVEITVDFIQFGVGFDQEALHWLEVMDLTHNVYNKPSRHVQEAFAEADPTNVSTAPATTTGNSSSTYHNGTGRAAKSNASKGRFQAPSYTGSTSSSTSSDNRFDADFDDAFLLNVDVDAIVAQRKKQK